MFILYDLIFLLVSVFYLPIYFFRGKFHSGFLARLGFLPDNLDLDRPIWVHAVSVGEAIVVRGLIEELRKMYPGKRFVISTVTVTGNKIARGIAREKDFVTYLPLDLSFIVRSVIDRINPEVFIIAETEIWPNLISYLARKHIPVITVNGRISDSSFRGYLSVKFLIKPILRRINIFCVQAERDRQRAIRLGVDPDRIHVTGNMKFDAKDYAAMKKDYLEYRRGLGVESAEKILVAGSSHPGEEEVVLDAYQALRRDFPNLRLLIAPRHPERAQEIGKIIERYGFEPERISQLSANIGKPLSKQAVFILDTIGELVSYYAISDIVFVGGSLVNTGGHNILEPAAMGKPILFGPFMFNFRDIAELFLKNKAAIKVNGLKELKDNIADLLSHPDKALQLGLAAGGLIIKNQGATVRNARLITSCLT